MRAPPLALVTGGCRRLGARVAAALALAGYDLALHGTHDAAPDADLADALRRAGVEWRGFPGDFREPGVAAGILPEVTQAFGRAPDLLVNSASLFGQDRLNDVKPRDLADAYAVNCAAAVVLTRAFVEAAGAGDRSVVNMLDQRIAHPHADQLSYTLGKAALAAFTTVASGNAAGVRVNGVAPGLTLPTADYADEHMTWLVHQMPLRRFPGPDEVAAAILFLATNKGVNGQVLFVDAGAGLKPFPADFMNLPR